MTADGLSKPENRTRLQDGKTDLALKGAITQPPPESPAARFFRTGEAPPPVAGRFDDFSYTE